MRAGSLRCTPLLAALAGAPTLATGQEVVRPSQPGRPVAFPPAVSLMVGVSTYGDRARSDSGLGTSEFTYRMSSGPTASARLRAPLGRRFGLQVGGGFTYRHPRVDRNGSPFVVADSQNIASFRAEGGLLYRFKPAAPIYFGAGLVYYRHGGDPVAGQGRGAMTETGGAFGVGYDFGQKPGSNLTGHVEYWNYFVGPNASGLQNGLTAKSTARDGAFSVGMTYRLGIRRRGGG